MARPGKARQDKDERGGVPGRDCRRTSRAVAPRIRALVEEEREEEEEEEKEGRRKERKRAT